MPGERVLHVLDTYLNLEAPYFARLAARASVDFPTSFAALGEQSEFSYVGWTVRQEVQPLGGQGRTKFLTALIPLARHIRRSGVGIVHAHFFFPTMVGLMASRLAGASFVFTRHHSDHNSRLGKPLHVAADRWCGRLADRAIAVSEATRDCMIKDGIDCRKITVVYNGTDGLSQPTPESVATVKHEIGVPVDAPMVLMVARLHEEKGHSTLFDALEALRHEVPNLWAVLAGEGDARERIETEIAGRGLRVRVLGRRDDVARLMAAADVLALPSRAESFGYVVVEAMGLGLPVVASRCGGIVEIVEDGRSGLLFEIDDSATLSRQIKQVLSNAGLRAALAARGKLRARDFSFERMLTGYEDVYRELVRSKNR